MKRLRRLTGRGINALLLPLSVVPMLVMAPLLVDAYSNFDRRHKSGPLPAPTVTFSSWEEARYLPQPAHPEAIPVITYHGINDKQDGYSVSQQTFARQMAMLRRTGFRTVSIAQYVRFLRGDSAGLPQRPILVTFDDGRLDSFRGADKVLQRYGDRATMFVIAGAVRRDNPFYLTWRELQGMSKSGRWDIQEHAGKGHVLINYDSAGHTGPFYAYRRWTRTDGAESLADWEQRVTTDIFAGRDALAEHIPGFRPWTFAVPYGNYGQRGTNDGRIPAVMHAFMKRQFEAVFVQDVGNDPGYTTPADHRGDAARFEVHTDTTVDDLFRWLRDYAPGAEPPAAARPKLKVKAVKRVPHRVYAHKHRHHHRRKKI